jgi:hypothetical protein
VQSEPRPTVSDYLAAPARLAGRPSNRRGRYPDFFIIGAARAGTTTLATELSHHPKVFVCDPKEPFFFSHESVRARGCESWYQGLFARRRPDQICREASTSYSCWPECGDVAGRIALAMSGARLIYLIRHPVERAYSHYHYYDVVRLGHQCRDWNSMSPPPRPRSHRLEGPELLVRVVDRTSARPG